eukprot:CAMPEP_0196828528 /NCGR_PEP_ID=MMETSP1362-20130617/94726_1 /TAXON_ID=163516 /ORGANISM="Leptocylindrus danicus, Strain CCMP1856" /LENGTH=85 /DNA_ID=CAMNT_0042209209 /DNA_START=267 /DNA_END=524 /DNA_ORIENTATION=+
MALSQCDTGILAIIKQSNGYEAQQLDLFWILKKIKEASHARGHKLKVLYPELVDVVLDVFASTKTRRVLIHSTGNLWRPEMNSTV